MVFPRKGCNMRGYGESNPDLDARERKVRGKSRARPGKKKSEETGEGDRREKRRIKKRGGTSPEKMDDKRREILPKDLKQPLSREPAGG